VGRPQLASGWMVTFVLVLVLVDPDPDSADAVYAYLTALGTDGSFRVQNHTHTPSAVVRFITYLDNT
jgi:hypothetical protein